MKTHTAFTLLDGSQHDSLKKAKEYCLEQMGAELRLFAFEKADYQYVYKMLLDIVAYKKHDKAIFAYCAWRKEHDALEAFERGEDEEDE